MFGLNTRKWITVDVQEKKDETVIKGFVELEMRGLQSNGNEIRISYSNKPFVATVEPRPETRTVDNLVYRKGSGNYKSKSQSNHTRIHRLAGDKFLNESAKVAASKMLKELLPNYKNQTRLAVENNLNKFLVQRLLARPYGQKKIRNADYEAILRAYKA